MTESNKQDERSNLFRKKPVVIAATQWFKDGDHPAVIRKSDPNRYADEGIPWVPTLEGGHIVTPGDWIITGVKGEHYPCKPDIFAATYEPAALATQAQQGEDARDAALWRKWVPYLATVRRQPYELTRDVAAAMAAIPVAWTDGGKVVKHG